MLLFKVLLVWSLAHATKPPFNYVHVDGGTIPTDSQCAAILTRAERRLNRELKPSEIAASLENILAATNEKLFYVQAPSPSCFTSEMKISTPHGDQTIGTFAVGDQVWSFDLAKSRLVKNRVRRVIVTQNQSYGLLGDLQVTKRERFYSRRNGVEDYVAIEDLAPWDRLFQQTGYVERGIFKPQVSRATVHNLELEYEPHNFFVEGYLVHNTKECSG